MKISGLNLTGHLAVLLTALIGLIYWYEAERIFYCYPEKPAACRYFSFGLGSELLIALFVLGLAGMAVPWLVSHLRNAAESPPGHAIYLLKIVPTAVFTGSVLLLTENRAGANDVEWVSLVSTVLVLSLALHGLVALFRGRPLQSGRGWIFAIIGILILLLMAALTMIVLMNMDRLF